MGWFLRPNFDVKKVAHTSRTRGETNELMTRLQDWNTSVEDSSVDQEFIGNSIGSTDIICWAGMLLFLPKMVISSAVQLALLLPPALAAAMDLRSMPEAKRVEPTLAMRALSAPAYCFALASYAVDSTLMSLMGLFLVMLQCKFSAYRKNHAILHPYKSGPWMGLTAVTTAFAGQVHRQGFLEASTRVAVMTGVVPYIKHWVIANRYIYDLEERYITQIGPSLTPLTQDKVNRFTHNISSAVVHRKDRIAIDAGFFAAHYPFPPQGTHTVVGMQMAKYFSTLVHTTHITYSMVPDITTPVYRVVLWESNPFHLFLGYVEAGFSNGHPSQRHKNNGVAHPMLLVTSKTWTSCYWVDFIDKYFEKYIPVMNQFILAS